jgi:hypothetical protein
MRSRDSGCAARDASRDDEALGRPIAPPPRCAIEQLVAAIGEIDQPALLQFRRPAIDHRAQHAQRLLPVRGQFGRDIERGQRRQRHLLDRQLIERAAQRLRQPHRLRRIDGLARLGALLEHQSREDHPPPHRIDRGWWWRLVGRIEGGAQRLAEIVVTDRDQAGQQQASLGAAHERICDRAAGTVAGDQDRAARERQRVAARARDQPGSERIGERPVRRHREHRRAGRISHV